MLYLIINEKSQPEQRWSINPDKDFAGLQVIGPALVNEKGEPVDSADLSLIDGAVVVDPVKVAASKAAREQELTQHLAKEAAKKLAHSGLVEKKGKSLSSAEVKEAVEELIALFL